MSTKVTSYFSSVAGHIHDRNVLSCARRQSATGVQTDSPHDRDSVAIFQREVNAIWKTYFPKNNSNNNTPRYASLNRYFFFRRVKLFPSSHLNYFQRA